MDTSQLKISIVVPVYNDAAYLQRAVRSCLAQTHSNIQIVCANDGSTDGSLELLRTLAKADERICVVPLERNAGTHNARLAGLRAAEGDLLTFLDADDELAPGFCERAASEYLREPYDVLHFATQAEGDGVVDEKTVAAITQWCLPYLGRLRDRAIAEQAFYWHAYPCNVAAKVFPTTLARDAFEAIGEVRTDMGEDQLEYFAIALAAQSYRGFVEEGNLQGYYLYHLGNGASGARQKNAAQFERDLRIRESVEAMRDFLDRCGELAEYEDIFQAHHDEQLRALVRTWARDVRPEDSEECLGRILADWPAEDVDRALHEVEHESVDEKRSAFVTVARLGMNKLYRLLCARTARQNEVLFLSRQATEPSYDFDVLAKQVEAEGWTATMHLTKVRSKDNSGSNTAGTGMLPYAFHVLQQLRLLARCRMVVLDRYDPVISLLDFDEQPCIVQLWHAFGAFKKFGYQSIGTREGHAQTTAETFSIHRNYTWIACSGEGVRGAFAQAFRYPKGRVRVFNRPEYFALNGSTGTGHEAHASDATVLFAPTLRKSSKSPHPFRALHEHRQDLEQPLAQQGMRAIWSFHPLEEKLPVPGNASALLDQGDIVVTDYSSIVYEAHLRHKPVVFYIPDLETYLASPGLNVNPVDICPDLCAFTPEELVERIRKVCANPHAALEALATFAKPAFEGAETAPSRLLDLLD